MRSILFLLTMTIAAMASAQLRGFPIDNEQLKARIAELNPPDKALPDNEFSLVDERRLLDQEISEVRSVVQQPLDLTKQIELIEKTKSAIAKSMQEIGSTDCSKLADSRFTSHFQIRESMSMLFRRQPVGRGFDTDLEPDPFALAPWQNEEFVGDSANCVRWKKFIGDNSHQSKLLEYFDKLKSKASDSSRAAADTKTSAVTLLDLLQKRKEAIEKKLVSQSTKTELSDKLWIVISVIGCFSIGAILAVKLFSDTIQIEWVASGQVIQFVTVMILLSVIMALGLAGILKENTLGTLLGGIAGYVLAQGVGRAAAREVSRSR